MQTYRNKKNQQIYKVISFSVRNATNSNLTPELPFVLYVNKYGEYFVRERNEFEEKFEKISCRECIHMSGWCENCQDCVEFNKYISITEIKDFDLTQADSD